MGQIANQMVLEWCHKMIQKMKDKTQEKKDSNQVSEKAGSEARNGDSDGERTIFPWGHRG